MYCHFPGGIREAHGEDAHQAIRKAAFINCFPLFMLLFLSSLVRAEVEGEVGLGPGLIPGLTQGPTRGLDPGLTVAV